MGRFAKAKELAMANPKVWKMSLTLGEHGLEWVDFTNGPARKVERQMKAHMRANGWEFLAKEDMDGGFNLTFQRPWQDNTDEDREKGDTHQYADLTVTPVNLR